MNAGLLILETFYLLVVCCYDLNFKQNTSITHKHRLLRQPRSWEEPIGIFCPEATSK